MKALIKKYKVLLIFAVIVLQFVGVILAIRNYSGSPGNGVLTIIVTVLALLGLFGDQRHDIASILNSLLMLAHLGWIFGPIEVVSYWALISIKRRPAAATTTGTPATPTAGGSLYKDRCFARVPLLRLPIPWIWYSFDENYLTRTVLGRAEDPYAFNKMYDVRIADPIHRKVFGTSFFTFKATKIHDDKETTWRGLYAPQAEQVLIAAKKHISGK